MYNFLSIFLNNCSIFLLKKCSLSVFFSKMTGHFLTYDWQSVWFLYNEIGQKKSLVNQPMRKMLCLTGNVKSLVILNENLRKL
jgi:hypothetical protein